ncbi:PepSY-associated TM helix domain-containing protein [Parapedobacter sp. DT-150]|uniref:PepSY-associated TM helix domain-containing protein n=1 Tax=Parapedobacter sp. DT-150 TaxID=3396162 RepID=UPI003F1DEFED
MNNRNYNTYFHLHTISGIIISAVLYVIFFAGSFSFFKDEITAWQRDASYVNAAKEKEVYTQLMDSLEREYDLLGRNVIIYRYPNSADAYVNVEPSQDTVLNKRASQAGYFYYNVDSRKQKTYEENYDMGEFLYRLHFLAQLNEVPIPIGYPFGYVVAGLVAFLFVFALITGLLLHWDKLVAGFYQFRPWAKTKAAWTDLHTVLGVIGFPYQFVFAFTGAVLIVNTLFVEPFRSFIYDGDGDKVYQDLGFEIAVESTYSGKPLPIFPSVQQYVDRVQAKWPAAFIKRIAIKNFGDEQMRVAIAVDADYRRSLAGTGHVIYDVASGTVVEEESPYGQPAYADYLQAAIYRLHFGDYGGFLLKIVYFVLGVMGCLVITSGIMIWLVARDKNNVAAHKRKFNRWLANSYMAICLTMFPVTALTFIAVKMAPAADMAFIYRVYFFSWLVFAVYYTVRKSINRTTRETLLLGSVLSLMVPLANGILAQNWLWTTFADGEIDILLLDMIWIVLGAISLLVYRKLKKKSLEQLKLKKAPASKPALQN